MSTLPYEGEEIADLRREKSLRVAQTNEDSREDVERNKRTGGPLAEGNFRAHVRQKRSAKAEIAKRAGRESAAAQTNHAKSMSEVFAAYLLLLERQKKPSLADIRSAVEVWLEPALGELEPSECGPQRIVPLVTGMLEAGLAPNTVRTKVAFVRSA